MIRFFRKIRQELMLKDKIKGYLKYAFGEIILVVFGILIALQVNNWNETRLEKLEIKKYAKSLVQDLQSDVDMLKIIEKQTREIHSSIDSLARYVSQTRVRNLSNTDLYILSRDNLYRPYAWNRSTFDEIKSSGGMRYIENDDIANKLVQYEAFSHHLDEDLTSDKVRSYNAKELSNMVINLNSPWFNKMETLSFSAGDSDVDLFKTPEYAGSKSNDLPLLTYDKTLINRMVNSYILIRTDYETRGYYEIPRIIGWAQSLINLLKKEYVIN